MELEWEQLVETTADKAESLTVKPFPPIVSESLTGLAFSSPTAAVLDSFAKIEIFLRLRLKVEDRRSWSRKRIDELVAEAYRQGLISKQVLSVIDNLIRLRNIAAHRLGETDISPEDALDYLRLVDYVMAALDATAEEVDELSRKIGF